MTPFGDLRSAMEPHSREKSIFRAKAILDRLDGGPIQLVRQEHPYGCAVASIAMIAHLAYNEVLERLGSAVTAKISSPNGGLTFLDTFDALRSLGFAVAPEWRGKYGAPRPDWTPTPECAVNIAEMRATNGSHVVVVLRDGTVLDPLHDEPRSIHQYECHWIAGVVPLQSSERESFTASRRPS